jgi:hypothetical protein
VSESDIPKPVRDFVTEHIDSVLQLEVLLLLVAQPARWFTPDDVGTELRIEPRWVSSQLERLCAANVLTCNSDARPASYRYDSTRTDQDAAVQGLAAAYAQRRVSVISLIFSKPVDRLRSFADAFRLRKDKPDG